MCRVAVSFLEPFDHAPRQCSGRLMSRVIGAGLVLAGHRQRGAAHRGDQHLEPFIVAASRISLAKARSFSTMIASGSAGAGTGRVVTDLIASLVASAATPAPPPSSTVSVTVRWLDPPCAGSPHPTCGPLQRTYGLRQVELEVLPRPGRSSA